MQRGGEARGEEEERGDGEEERTSTEGKRKGG